MKREGELGDKVRLGCIGLMCWGVLAMLAASFVSPTVTSITITLGLSSVLAKTLGILAVPVCVYCWWFWIVLLAEMYLESLES